MLFRGPPCPSLLASDYVVLEAHVYVNKATINVARFWASRGHRCSNSSATGILALETKTLSEKLHVFLRHKCD